MEDSTVVMLQDDHEMGGRGSKRGRFISWNPTNELLLVQLVQKHLAYKKTNRTLTDKWTMVTRDFFEQSEYKGTSSAESSTALHKKFERLKKGVVSRSVTTQIFVSMHFTHENYDVGFLMNCTM